MRSEFELINHIKKRSALQGTGDEPAAVGIGDDCAVVAKDENHDLVITTDLLVEDVDFRLRWARPHQLGHKALAVSLSDVAAMGARPVWSMISIGVPQAIWESGFIDEFYSGYLGLARRYGVQLIGGDISKTPDRIVIDSIVAGEAPRGQAVLRSGARPGDTIFVSGSLGGAAAGLKLLERHNDPEELFGNPLVLRQFRPEPRIDLGQTLLENRLASSMIDLSDGLAGDLRHLCEASGVGAVLDLGSLPLDPALRENSSALFASTSEAPSEGAASIPPAARLALSGGEDFELLFTVHPERLSRIAGLTAGIQVTRIGEITAKPGSVEAVAGGRLFPLDVDSFRHF